MTRSALLATTILLAAASEGGTAQEPTAVAQRAAAGAQLFGSKGCAGCHAIDGVGGGIGPDLGRVTGPPSFFGLAARMWNHLPAMAARMRAGGTRPPTLAPWEAGDLAAFLFAARYYNPAGDPRRGEAAFVGKRCVVCHQVRGVGGVIGPLLDGVAARGSPIELATALWNHAPLMEREMRARGVRRPVLTGTDLGDLRAFLAETATPPDVTLHLLPGRDDVGARLFREKRCASCHRPGGGAPNLSAVPRRDLAEFAAAMWNKAPRMLEAARRVGVELPRLEPGEMADLVAHLASLQYLAGEGSAGRGAARLRDLRCARCHAPGRSAPGARAQTETRAGLLAGLWNHIALPDSLIRGEWPELDATDVADLAAYFDERGNRL
jgi:mono/diheme cytochrome c family protein